MYVFSSNDIAGGFGDGHGRAVPCSECHFTVMFHLKDHSLTEQTCSCARDDLEDESEPHNTRKISAGCAIRHIRSLSIEENVGFCQ